jgi:hypothetical protein
VTGCAADQDDQPEPEEDAMNPTPVPPAGRKPWIGAAALVLPALLATLNFVSSLDPALLGHPGLTAGGVLWIVNAATLLLQDASAQMLERLIRRICGGSAEQ